MDGLVIGMTRFLDDFFTRPAAHRRCSVIALLNGCRGRGGLSGKARRTILLKPHKIYNKKGDSYQTTAYKAPSTQPLHDQRGFDYLTQGG